MMESRYVADCDCYLPEIEPLEGASVPSQADIFGVSGTVAERPDGYDPLALPALQRAGFTFILPEEMAR